MRARVVFALLALLALVASAWTASLPAPLSAPPMELPEEPEASGVQMNQVQPWNQAIRPAWHSGWTPQLWQPQPTGSLWEVDFSPNGELIAAVDNWENLLVVWNASDGRTVFYAEFENPLFEVVWLDDSHVLAADGNTRWYSYEIIDDGGMWPMNSTVERTGRWSADLSGAHAGWLWGLDITHDRSKVVFCGDIDDPNIGGEVIVADVGFFIDDGPSNSAHVYPTNWGADCAISANGTFVAALNRVQEPGNGPYRDTVTGWEVAGNILAESWTRNVAGAEAMAWAIDFSPGGNTYTIGYNRPTEGVVADFFQENGNINWYSPLPQNISSVRWAPDGTMVGVGLHDPGRLLTLDGAGAILSDYSWHGTVWAGKAYAADIAAVAVDDGNTRFATVGRSGTVEIHTINPQTSQLDIHRRLGTDLMREIDAHPIEPHIAFAESAGVATVRDYRSARIIFQCFHPDYDQPIAAYPYAKSVVMHDMLTIVGFSDGTIIACSEDGKQLWEYRIPSNNPDFEAFGRMDIHPMENFLAMSWTENISNSGFAGKVSILDLDQMSEVTGWGYATEYWTMEFSGSGAWLASAGQDGTVRLWQTDDPDPALWSDQGSPYSHGNYTGAVAWHTEFNFLMTAGWDGEAILWDADNSQQILNFQFTDEAFGVAFISGSFLVVASGDSSDSASGQLEFYDGLNMTQIGSWPVDGIPRGLALPNQGGLVVANHTGSWWVLIPDSDGDGIIDELDEFPNNPLQWIDTDGDGFGDNNAPGAGGDGCITVWGTSTLDRGGCPDTDGDEWSDPDAEWPVCVLGVGYGDAWPDNPEQWCDADGDGHGDQHLYEIDSSSGLRMNERGDAFPNDPSQWRDLDGDGIGDNHSFTLGTDGLRQDEVGDAFPTDPLQSQDTDSDGWGDAYSFNLGMDGLRQEIGDAFFLDPLAWSDLDGDGCPTASDTGLSIDNHPEDPSRCDEALDFDLPAQFNIHADEEDDVWTISLDWKSASENTDRIHLYGLGWNATEGMEHLMLNIEPPGALPWQAWDDPGTGVETFQFTWDQTGDNDRLTLRLITWSTDGQRLESWANFTATADEEPIEPPDPVDPADPADEGDDPPVEVNEESTPDAGLSPVMWAAMLIGALAILLIGAMILRRKPDVLGEPPSVSSGMHAPCTECGGMSHETVHNGDRWTWCPTCRKWLTYLGKA